MYFRHLPMRSPKTVFYIETIAANTPRLVSVIMQGNTWKKWVRPQWLGGTFIDLKKPCWQMSLKQQVILWRPNCQDQCLWTCELALHHSMNDWCFDSSSSEDPVKLSRSSDIEKMTASAVLIFCCYLSSCCNRCRYHITAVDPDYLACKSEDQAW